MPSHDRFYAEYRRLLRANDRESIQTFLASNIGKMCPKDDSSWLWNDERLDEVILEARKNLLAEEERRIK